ncbi:hypothetical protein D3C81_1537460 [compost metagenome]
MVGRCVLVAPQATRLQIDDLHTPVARGDFQAQTEIGTDHHRQLTDEHQPVCGDVAQKADRLVGDAVEHFQKIRQLMPLDTAVSEHAQFAQQGP